MDRFRLEILPLARELQMPAPHGGILTTTSGNYETIFKGTGLEFRDFRKFTPTDDSKRIDWKASLKADKLVIREYQEERNAEVLFCYDVSDGMVFGSKKLKAHYGAEFIVSLVKHIIDSDDAAGLITFTDQINYFIPPEKGYKQTSLIMDILSSFSTYGGKPGFKNLLKFLETKILQGTTIFLVSDFFSFKKYNKHATTLKLLRSKFELIFVILRDTIEEYLPTQKQFLLVNPITSLNMLISTSKIRNKYAKETKKQKQELINFLKELNIAVLELYTDKSFIEPLYNFFEGMKNR